MKFFITEPCAHSSGIHAEPGEVLTLSETEARNLAVSGRGVIVPDDFQTPAEKAAAAKAAEEAASAAAEKAEAEAKAKAEADEKAAAAKAAKK